MRLKIISGILIALVLIGGMQGCSKKATHATKDYSNEKSVSITMGQVTSESGLLRAYETGDGATKPTKIGGQDCQRMQPTQAFYDSYIYFKVDPSFKKSTPINLKARVEYFDATPCEFRMEFDGMSHEGKFDGAYSKSEERVKLTGDQQWKTAEFTLKNCRLTNRQNGGADLRLRVANSEFFVRSVVIERE